MPLTRIEPFPEVRDELYDLLTFPSEHVFVHTLTEALPHPSQRNVRILKKHPLKLDSRPVLNALQDPQKYFGNTPLQNPSQPVLWLSKPQIAALLWQSITHTQPDWAKKHVAHPYNVEEKYNAYFQEIQEALMISRVSKMYQPTLDEVLIELVRKNPVSEIRVETDVDGQRQHVGTVKIDRMFAFLLEDKFKETSSDLPLDIALLAINPVMKLATAYRNQQRTIRKLQKYLDESIAAYETTQLLPEALSMLKQAKEQIEQGAMEGIHKQLEAILTYEQQHIAHVPYQRLRALRHLKNYAYETIDSCAKAIIGRMQNQNIISSEKMEHQGVKIFYPVRTSNTTALAKRHTPTKKMIKYLTGEATAVLDDLQKKADPEKGSVVYVSRPICGLTRKMHEDAKENIGMYMTQGAIALPAMEGRLPVDLFVSALQFYKTIFPRNADITLESGEPFHWMTNQQMQAVFWYALTHTHPQDAKEIWDYLTHPVQQELFPFRKQYYLGKGGERRELTVKDLAQLPKALTTKLEKQGQLWLPVHTEQDQDARVYFRNHIEQVPLQVVHLLDYYFFSNAVRQRIQTMTGSIIRQLEKAEIITRIGPDARIGQTHVMLNKEYLN